MLAVPNVGPIQDEGAIKIHREVSLPQPLHDTLDRLSRHDRVLGVLLIASLAVGALTPASAYDLGVRVVAVEEDARLPPPDTRFDLVINRHESFDPHEVRRILRPGGLFLTQQVGGQDNVELNQALQERVTLSYSAGTPRRPRASCATRACWLSRRSTRSSP